MHIANRTIAVTGATGFLGGYLVQALRDRGAHVVAVVRDREKARRLLPSDVELRIAKLEDRVALTSAFASVDAVISNAAIVSFRHPKLTWQTNVEGTRNVFEALAEAQVARAVAISSTTVYRPALGTVAEDAPLRSTGLLSRLDSYGASKAEAERVARKISERRGIALTTLRPCGITGPHDPLLMRAIETAMSLRLVPFPAFTTIGVAHAADVAEAAMLALERAEVSAARAYNVQGCTATLWAIADAWRRAGGQAPWLRLPLPVPFALRYDDARVRRELGWQPRSLDAIVAEAVKIKTAAAAAA